MAASEQTLEKTRAEVEGKLQAQQATFDAERGKLEGRIADLETSLAEVRPATQTAEAELAAVRARENALQEELDKHGRAGWELVNIVHAFPTVSSPTMIFKKEA